ncbi:MULTISPECIES: hypothetical protein [Shewanella]|uniref:hypothetical protein n=1 Tax=Shewanella TaxID=22 RepID=UPI001BBCF9C8|nr:MULTISPECIES: hypothetical protein [Shewanella]GIU50717.1 hypothetical protein TUM4249_12450 [Shewanella sp. KT0246]
MFKSLILATFCIAPFVQAGSAPQTLSMQGADVSALRTENVAVSAQQSTDVQSAVLENINRFNGYEQTAGQVSRNLSSQNMQQASEQDKSSVYSNSMPEHNLSKVNVESNKQLNDIEPAKTAAISVSSSSVSRNQFDAISVLLTSTGFSSDQKIKLIQVLSQ